MKISETFSNFILQKIFSGSCILKYLLERRRKKVVYVGFQFNKAKEKFSTELFLLQGVNCECNAENKKCRKEFEKEGGWEREEIIRITCWASRIIEIISIYNIYSKTG